MGRCILLKRHWSHPRLTIGLPAGILSLLAPGPASGIQVARQSAWSEDDLLPVAAGAGRVRSIRARS